MKMLEVNDLTTEFSTENGTVKAVRDVSFYVDKGEVLGVVGESGSGKSQTMFSIMGLLAGNGSVTNGSIKIDGEEIAPTHFDSRKKYEETMDRIRGNDMAMIFQDPMTFLNPTLRIETQLIEPIINHNPKISKKEARDKAIDLMRKVGIPSPEDRIRQYPHQFSGGMRQRIIIAIALACDPKVIIADEPTTALDVTIQAQVLDLIGSLKDEIDSSIIMITHDLGVVASICDRIAIPEDLEKKELHPIPGSPPDLLNISEGCPFLDRCENAMNICVDHMDEYRNFSSTHCSSCWLNNPYLKRKGE